MTEKKNKPISGLVADRINRFLGRDTSDYPTIPGLPADMIRKYKQAEILRSRLKKRI